MKRNPTSAQANRSGGVLESRARTAIEERLGRVLDDEEFKQMRQRLIEFVVTLQRWDEQRKAASMEGKQACKETDKPAA